MKTTNKILATICAVAIILSSFAIIMLAYETPVDQSIWENPTTDFSDYAYSIAFVGDPQYLTNGDATEGTEKLKTQFGYIVDSADERKLEHVFVLGDMTNNGYKNDGNLAAGPEYPGTAEWNIVKEAIVDQMSGMSYQVNRGNHDDYMIDDYFNVPAYTNQFIGCGGFYTDEDVTYPSNYYDPFSGHNKSNSEWRNNEGYVNWSYKKYTETGNGHYTDSIVNSYKTANICGVNYIFITIDHNPTDGVVEWLDSILTEYYNYRAIVTTHHYLTNTGELAQRYDGAQHKAAFGNYPTVLWNEVLSKHENVFMIVSGHTGSTVDLVSNIAEGEKGNEVLQVLVNPQVYDYNSESSSGTQDTGLVLYMNFSADGKTVTFDYYSTLLNKSLSSAKITLELNPKVFNDLVITKQTASVRLQDSISESGLRFKTAIKTSALNDFIDEYGSANVSIGTLIAPANLWEGRALRHSDGTDQQDYIDVEATVGSPCGTEGEYSIYSGSIINIEEENYRRDFIAVGYIKVVTDEGPVYIYSDVTARRSIFDVAYAAYNDVSDSYDEEIYKYEITDETDPHYGKYSKYTAANREVLYQYISNEYNDKNDPFEFDKFD